MIRGLVPPVTSLLVKMLTPARSPKRSEVRDSKTVRAYVEAHPVARRSPSRYAVWLLYFEERQSEQETARALGIAKQTVRSHLRRLRLLARSWFATLSTVA